MGIVLYMSRVLAFVCAFMLYMYAVCVEVRVCGLGLYMYIVYGSCIVYVMSFSFVLAELCCASM